MTRTNPFLPQACSGALVLFLVLVGSHLPSAVAADRLILRNLDLIADRTVIAVDEDGIQLDRPRPGGSDRLTWDEIERGRVSVELQREFDRLKKELGPSLFKLRQRLRIGDYAGLLEPAEELYPRYANRQSQSAYLVSQSLMWGRLAAGRREEAVEPFLRCLGLLAGGAADARRLPGPRRLLTSAEAPLCGDLPPVWLDRQAAKDVLPAVQTAIKAMPMPRPAEAYLYYASLASEAGEYDEAHKVLEAMGDAASGANQAKGVVAAQLQIQRRGAGGLATELESLAETGVPAVVALARYWRGKQLLMAGDTDQKRDGLLSLLSIPANDQKDQAELGAAALHQAAAALQELGDAAGASAVRRELTTRYGATAVGVQVSMSKTPP